MAKILVGANGVHSAVGQHLGYAPAITIAQQQLDQFTIATGTSGHDGLLALALSNFFLPQIVEIQGFDMGVNYGCEAVRFGKSLRAYLRIRAGASLKSASDVPGGLQTLIEISVEIVPSTGDPIPCCTIESLSRWY